MRGRERRQTRDEWRESVVWRVAREACERRVRGRGKERERETRVESRRGAAAPLQHASRVGSRKEVKNKVVYRVIKKVEGLKKRARPPSRVGGGGVERVCIGEARAALTICRQV